VESIDYDAMPVLERERAPKETFQVGPAVPIWHDVNGVLKNSRESATACFRGMIPLLCAHSSIKRADETRTGD
jgi:hypothetical protein